MMRRLSARRGDDSGMALVLVIGVCSVLTIAIVAGIALAVGSMRKSRADQDWSGAIAAAYAGIEEYQSRLANDTSYFQYGNPAATFSKTSKVSLPSGGSTNPAFGIGTAGTWATIPGSGGAASYRYEVDTSAYAASGTIKLRSTGRAGGDTRSIVADLKQSGFIDFLYFTDYEIQDPANSGKSEATCAKYAWAGRPGGLSGNQCSEIAFGSNDVVDGPAHSNDVMRICDATFKGPVTTAYNPASGRKFAARNSSWTSCNGATFTLPNSPAYSPVIGMPATNSELRREVRSDLPGEVPRPGCLYTGPTTITFSSNGNMTVRSPWTKATNVAGSPATSGTAPAACGTVGTGSNGLGSAGGATFKVPEYNVVYVQNVPTVTSDPNYWASAALPSGLKCTGVGTSGVGNGIGYPAANEVAPSTTSYGCRNGDAFVSGTLAGQLTVAAENYIYAVGDITYKDVENDLLGLIGNNAVWVWNPVDSGKKALLGTNRTIKAAILSVAHTFQVQNYDKGDNRGTLNVYGAIAQKFRGIVRSGSNGYAKSYIYDDRFRYTAPPKFLSPVTTTYGVSLWVEVDKVFDESGGYR
jgi:Tfp pilus assembly protein PilX